MSSFSSWSWLVGIFYGSVDVYGFHGLVHRVFHVLYLIGFHVFQVFSCVVQCFHVLSCILFG